MAELSRRESKSYVEKTHEAGVQLSSCVVYATITSRLLLHICPWKGPISPTSSAAEVPVAPCNTNSLRILCLHVRADKTEFHMRPIMPTAELLSLILDPLYTPHKNPYQMWTDDAKLRVGALMVFQATWPSSVRYLWVSYNSKNK